VGTKWCPTRNALLDGGHRTTVDDFTGFADTASSGTTEKVNVSCASAVSELLTHRPCDINIFAKPLVFFARPLAHFQKREVVVFHSAPLNRGIVLYLFLTRMSSRLYRLAWSSNSGTSAPPRTSYRSNTCSRRERRWALSASVAITKGKSIP